MGALRSSSIVAEIRELEVWLTALEVVDLAKAELGRVARDFFVGGPKSVESATLETLLFGWFFNTNEVLEALEIESRIL